MKLSVVILAAGLGTRMKSPIPKVAHTIYGKPMIKYVIDAVNDLEADNIIIVLGPHSSSIKDLLKDYPIKFAIQKEPKGTADALKAGLRQLKNFKGSLLVLNGDVPLITSDTLRKFLSLHEQNKEDISLISFIADNPNAYGRVIRNGKAVKAIIEDNDAYEEQKSIKEVNSGIYAIRHSALGLLKEIKMNKKKAEYYLTDIVDIGVRKGYSIGAHLIGDEKEFIGINNRQDLYKASLYLKERILTYWNERGITFMDRSSVYIYPEVKIGEGTLIYPNVYIEGNTSIGKGCLIYPNTRIVDSEIGDNVVIKDSTVIEASKIEDNAVIGPFTHIRPESLIGPSAKIGNFVEIKKSILGKGVKASHLSYLGDAEIGEDVNIGAGTITCNYDGKKKHKTIIEAGAFIGSDSQLIAPVRIGKSAYVGAGTTVTKDVPPFSLAVSRTKQKNIEMWAKKRQSRGKK